METKSYTGAWSPDGSNATAGTSFATIDGERYVIGDEIGRGGMGRVVEAHDRRLGRAVAIKELLSEEPDRVLRFEREARITARLQHPAIIHVYEAGLWPDGQPFYAMPRVVGRSLDKVVAEQTSFAERLGLVRHVIAAVDALAYAHAQGVIHRDLKPSNVLVGGFGETVVIDWGLAKRADAQADVASSGARLDSSAAETVEGSVLGTPGYMAPEQARGESVDERSDVYSLGALLYHVLVGAPPYGRDTSEAILARSLAGPPAAITTREPDVPVDLAAIVTKSMAREPAVRYRDAGDMVADLKRFETGQLVAARRYTIGQRIIRTVRRHKVVAALATALVVVGIVSVVRIAVARDEAEDARAVATSRNDQLVLLQARAELTRDPTAALAWLKRYPLSGGDWKTALQIASDARARGVARDVWKLDAIGPVAISNDDRTIAVGGDDGSLTLLDTSTGARTILHGGDATSDRVVFSPDGRTIVTTDHDRARIWDMATGRSRLLSADQIGGSTIDFSSDGAFVTIRHNYAEARLWRLPAGDEISFPTNLRRAIAFVPRSHQIAMTTTDSNEVQVFDLDASRTVAKIALPGSPADVSVSGNGAWVAVAYGRGGSLFLWNPATGAHNDVPAAIPAVAWIFASPDGSTFTSCGPDSTQLWRFDVAAAKASQIASDEGCFRQARGFSPDGSVFMSTGFGSELRLHLIAEGRTRELIGHDGAIVDAAFSHDGRYIVSTATDHTVRLWDWRAGETRLYHRTVTDGRASHDGRLLAKSPDGFANIDLVRGTRESLAVDPSTVRDSYLSMDGRSAALLLTDRTIQRFDLVNHTHQATAPLIDPAMDSISVISADGRLLAFVSPDGTLRIADLDTAAVRDVVKFGDRVFALAFSDNGRELAVGCRDGTTRVIDVATGAERSRIHVPSIPWNVSFSSDSKQLATAWLDGVVRILDIDTGLVRELRGHVGAVVGAEITADGHVLSGGADGTVRLWDLEHGTSLVERRDPFPINSIHTIAGSSLVVDDSSMVDLFVVWDLAASPPMDATPFQLLTWLASTTTADVDLDGKLATPAP